MSMSTHVVGFKPQDEKWKRMKAVFDACESAGLDAPDEVLKFFDYAIPDVNGVRVEEEKLPVVPWVAPNGAEGIELDVSKLDPDIKIIRFYNSW